MSPKPAIFVGDQESRAHLEQVVRLVSPSGWHLGTRTIPIRMAQVMRLNLQAVCCRGRPQGWPSAILQGQLDPLLCDLIAAGDALYVHAEEHVDAVAGPCSHLGGIACRVQPSGDAGMPEVVRPGGH